MHVIITPTINYIKGRLELERSQDWFFEAESDLEHARSDLKHGFYNWACFSAQQAAEKAVKAVFQKKGAEAWGHSVYDLLKELAQALEAGLELDKAYIPTRYPNAHPSGSARSRYTAGEAERLIALAEKIIKFCEGLLSTL